MAAPKKKSLSLDFSATESSGPRDVPEGDYILQVVKVEEAESQAGNPMLKFEHKVSEGPYKGAKVWDNVSLTPQALWRFRAMLESLGFDASGKLNLDLASLVGKTFTVKIIQETYNDKVRARIGDFLKSSAPRASNSSAASPIKKGSKVSFESEGDTYQGTVASISGGVASVAIQVDDDTTEEWEIEVNDLKLSV